LIVPFSTQEGFTEQLTDAEFRSFSPDQQRKLINTSKEISRKTKIKSFEYALYGNKSSQIYSQ
jgi:hypothetical protein